jgi:hypothetical protein
MSHGPSRGYLRQLSRLPAAELFCREHEYCRNWERPPSGSDARRFAKTHFRRSVRRGFARDLIRDLAAS